MDVGVYTFATDRNLVPQRFAQEVEARGFKSLMLPEHSHVPVRRSTAYPNTYGGGILPDFYKRIHDPFVALSFIAAATSTLRLGTGICLLALRDPVHTAKSVASLDFLSGGRVVFGVGFGWNADEFPNHGVSFERRHTLVREKVQLIRRLWTDDIAEFHGEEVRLERSWAWPKPVQRPHPPIYLGGNGPLTMRHAAEWADAWYPTGPLDDPDLTRAVPVFRGMVADAGRDPSSVRIAIAPAECDERRFEMLARNGVDECNVAVMGSNELEITKKLDTLALAWSRALGL